MCLLLQTVVSKFLGMPPCTDFLSGFFAFGTICRTSGRHLNYVINHDFRLPHPPCKILTSFFSPISLFLHSERPLTPILSDVPTPLPLPLFVPRWGKGLNAVFFPASEVFLSKTWNFPYWSGLTPCHETRDTISSTVWSQSPRRFKHVPDLSVLTKFFRSLFPSKPLGLDVAVWQV